MTSVSVCPLSKRVAKIKPTGDISRDFVLEQERTAFCQVMDMLWQYPQHRIACRDFVQSCIRNQQAEQKIRVEGMFAVGVPTLGKVPEEWICAWLTTRSGLSMQDLGKIKAFDGSAISHMWLFELNATAQTKLPAACQMQDIMHRVATMRATEVGGRLKDVRIGSKSVGADGKVNWAILGEYGFASQDGFVTNITHKASGVQVAVPQNLKASVDFELRDNWSSKKAMFKKGLQQYRCIEFFDAGAGPNLAKPLSGETDSLKGFADQASVARKALLDEKLKSEVVIDTDALHTPIREKQKEATKRAREASEKKEENMAKRRLTIGQGIA